ncbi:MAG: VPLPA-CTERM sorting domain-containing protein [Proteobacteria bacterium]|nr:VPLPA-CTERM sorting domain-containing protein [Pseudomonadota bacterium]MBU1389643.1 VPLPA-CTERM sorting domain-containing protein [Pseudomonadota bacterium]MBU1542581.1 VPLPA-CTERM sorting domain-containing protein [Pseudomonadota bacterium]MBU2431513.1 VPLPA-CTERM sorting domain-containing protein [Pseudomonadota bacterium]
MKRVLFFCVFLIVLGFSNLASAVLVVDTGAPDNIWPSSFVGGYGQAGNTSQWLAGQFTLDKGYDIYEMQGYLAVNVQGEVLITIYEDSNGRPGDFVFSKTFMSEDGNSSFYGWQGTSGYAGHLDAGTYWIAFGAPDNSIFEGGMGTSNLISPIMDAEAYRANMGGELGWSDWQVAPLDYPDFGFGVYARIEGSPVPVPGAIWLLGSGIIGLAGLRRKY